MIVERFKNKVFREEKLIAFGFQKKQEGFIYQTVLFDQFEIVVTIKNKCLETCVLDEFHEEYILHHVASAQGSFVGKVREAYEEVLEKIEANCCEEKNSYSEGLQKIIAYVSLKYDDELEYLWKNSKNAIWRRKDNHSWYGACLLVSKRKLGLNSDEIVEVINVRVQSDALENLIDHVHFFPAYHMNKKHWVSIVINESISIEEVCHYLELSYQLTKK